MSSRNAMLHENTQRFCTVAQNVCMMLDESTDDGWRLTIGCDIRATLVTYWNRVAAVIASADAGLGSIDLSFSLCTQVAETGGQNAHGTQNSHDRQATTRKIGCCGGYWMCMLYGAEVWSHLQREGSGETGRLERMGARIPAGSGVEEDARG